MDKEIENMPEGLKRFVDLAIDLLDIKVFFPNFAKNNGILNGRAAWIELIRCFLKLEIIYNKEKVPIKYEKMRYIYDLPDEDIKMCLIYMGYELGMTEHTGGINFYDLYKKNIRLN